MERNKTRRTDLSLTREIMRLSRTRRLLLAHGEADTSRSYWLGYLSGAHQALSWAITEDAALRAHHVVAVQLAKIVKTAQRRTRISNGEHPIPQEAPDY